jgi:hypothetical protein
VSWLVTWLSGSGCNTTAEGWFIGNVWRQSRKGLNFPHWNVQRFLLWFGCLDIAVGVGVYIVLSVMMSFPPNKFTEELPQGIQYVGVIPVGMGIAHLIAYFVETRRRAIS